ncbi:MAG: glycosyl transferase [Alphaproteobacteria bacterium]|nr:glycosyl transferase [Alphaproteobacteria bacterium]
MSQRIFIWVQHLLGFGHFARARAISEALRDAGFDVTLVSGGVTPVEAVPQGVAFVQLPPARAQDELFDALVDERGAPVDQAWHERRREALLGALETARPDVVITETFPFGRRLLQFELSALIARAEQLVPRPLLVASVRDVLVRPRKPERAAAMVQFARAHYDAVIVHGDAAVIRLEESFAETAALGAYCHYTGYVCGEMPAPLSARREVLVSAGGGAAGRHLIEAALDARRHSRLKDRQWTFVTGPLSEALPETAREAGVEIVRSLPDFRQRLAGAAVSISQAGYNTLVEAVKARTPTVAVPFETEREKEQIMRAERFAERGLITVLRADRLDPVALARAVDDVADTEPGPNAIDCNGRAGTVRALRAILAGGRRAKDA